MKNEEQAISCNELGCPFNVAMLPRYWEHYRRRRI
jgi:hypothetical protein